MRDGVVAFMRAKILRMIGDAPLGADELNARTKAASLQAPIARKLALKQA
jgi:hypothetical protein